MTTNEAQNAGSFNKHPLKQRVVRVSRHWRLGNTTTWKTFVWYYFVNSEAAFRPMLGHRMTTHNITRNYTPTWPDHTTVVIITTVTLSTMNYIIIPILKEETKIIVTVNDSKWCQSYRPQTQSFIKTISITFHPYPNQGNHKLQSSHEQLQEGSSPRHIFHTHDNHNVVRKNKYMAWESRNNQCSPISKFTTDSLVWSKPSSFELAAW